MATASPRSTEIHRIIIHGNKDYKSSQLMNQLKLTEENTTLVKSPFEFFSFSDLDEIANNKLFEPNHKLVNLIENSEQDIEVSAILVLISQKDTMSKVMSKLITKIPHNHFYSFNEENETDWWDHVILVFVSDEDESEAVDLSNEENIKIKERVKRKLGRYNCILNSNSSIEIIERNNLDAKIKDTMKRNGAIKEFVKKSGGRYISISEKTSDKEIIEELLAKMEPLKDKITVGQLPHSKRYDLSYPNFCIFLTKLIHMIV